MDKDFGNLLDRMTSAGFDVEKMPRRQFIKVAAGMVGMATLAACGSTTGAGSGSNLTLTQWYHEYGESGTEQAVKRYAKAYSKANVKVNWTPGDYASKLAATLAAPGGVPDLYESQPTLTMVKANQVVDVTDLYTPDILSDYTQATLDTMSIQGKIYGVKIVDDTSLLYYRKSLLQKAGLQPPTTMDELINASKVLTSGKMKGLYLGNDGGIGAIQNGLMFWSGGGDALQNDQITFDNDRTVLAIMQLRELNQNGSLLMGAPTDWWDPSAFTQGLAAMQWTGLWAMPAIIKALGDDFGIMPWPALDASGKPSTWLGGWTQMINGHSPHIDEAKAFAKWLWMDNAADETDFNLSYGFHLPPRKSVAAQASKLQSGPAAEAVQLVHTYGRSMSPLFDATMYGYLTAAISNVVKNGSDAKSEVSKAAQLCQKQLSSVLSS